MPEGQADLCWFVTWDSRPCTHHSCIWFGGRSDYYLERNTEHIFVGAGAKWKHRVLCYKLLTISRPWQWSIKSSLGALKAQALWDCAGPTPMKIPCWDVSLKEISTYWGPVRFTINKWGLPVDLIKQKIHEDQKNSAGELEEKHKFHNQLSEHKKMLW